MFKLKSGIFFILFFFFSICFAEDKLTELDKIVVLRNKGGFTGRYSLSSKDLIALPFSSPVEALSILPLNLQARSPNSSIQTDFSLRGSNYQGVRVLLDGEYINDPQTGHHNSDIPLTKEDIACVEVIPGISPLNLGPDAIGGVVNFITKRPDGKKVVLELTGGEYQTWGGLFSVSDKIKDLGVRFSLENKKSRGFSEDTDFKKFTANMASSLDIPLGTFDLDFGYQEKEFGAYDFYTPGLGYPSREWTKVYLLNTGLNLGVGSFTVKPNFLWRRHFDKFMLDKTGVRSNYLVHHRTDIYTPSLYLNKDSTILGKIGLGLEYSEEKINSTTLGKHSRERKSIFVDDSYYFLDSLSINSSLRIDDYNGVGTSYTGGIKLTREFFEANFLHFGVSRSMRIPSFTELYYNDPTTIGNAALSPEKSLSYEAGYNHKREKFSWGLAFFFRNEDNFIDWVKPIASKAKWEASNIATADVFGVEERVECKINDKISLNASYSYVNRRKNDNGYSYKYGENYAHHLVNFVSFFRFDFGTQEIGFTYKKTPGRNGWFLMHARLSCDLNKYSEFFFSATNIFNVEYQEIEGIPSPGRWIEGGLRLKW
ncbi:MAG: TonB-dependent receptor [Candidatus Omnitrophota bacterium]|jgi:iron complex outermembrane receptor protein